jgi:ribosomal protein L37E
MQMTNKDDPWKRHRTLKRVSFLGVVFYLFPTIALAWLEQIDMRSPTMYVLGFGWVIFGLVMLTLWHEVRCPRCGQRFYAKGMEFWQMARECLHCGLPKYADVSTAPEHSSGQ